MNTKTGCRDLLPLGRSIDPLYKFKKIIRREYNKLKVPPVYLSQD